MISQFAPGERAATACWRRRLRGLALGVLILIPAPAPSAAPSEAAVGAALRNLAAEDARVARIAFALTTANVDLCRTPANAGGFIVQALDQYDRRLRAAARDAFDLDQHVAVLAVAPHSPADRAGLLAGDHLVAVDGRPLPVTSGASSRGRYGTVAAALDMIQAALNRGDTRLDIVRAGSRSTILIHPVPGCIVRTQLVTSSRLNAFADDRYASVSTAIVRFASDDAELAFIIGHELAHGFLRHQALLSRRGEASPRLVLKTEQQADYVSLYMLARAGFDIDRIPDFLRRYGKASGPILSFVKDHPSSRERVAAAEATIAEIRGKQARGEPLTPSL